MVWWNPSDQVQGTLDLLILKTISLEPKDGWLSPGAFNRSPPNKVRSIPVCTASNRSWIKAKWVETETGRQAKFYSLTATGRTPLKTEAANWSRLCGAISLIVESI